MVPDKFRSRMEQEIPHVVFHYLWKPRYSLLLNWMRSTLRLLPKLHRGEAVVLFVSFLPFLVLMSWCRRVRCFPEVTEYPLLFNNGWIMRCFRRMLLRRYKHFAGVLVISNNLKKWFMTQGVKEEAITVLNMIGDSERFASLKADPAAPRAIAYCGHVSIFKDGVPVLIQAFQKIAPKYPELELHLYGPFQDAATETKLRALAAESHEDRIHFFGRTDRARIPQLLKNASILALTRPDNIQAHFGFPTKLGEYLLTSNPVVATRVGEIPDFLNDKIDAVLIKPDDVGECAEAFDWLLSHPEEMRRIGEAGCSVALKSFHYRTETEKMLTAINQQ